MRSAAMNGIFSTPLRTMNELYQDMVAQTRLIASGDSAKLESSGDLRDPLYCNVAEDIVNL